MCCHSDLKPTFFPTEYKKELDELSIKGSVLYKPQSFADRVFLNFQRLELVEKIAEVVDESFHLLGPLIEKYLRPSIYQTSAALHEGAHELEHLLHAGCFVRDVFHYMTTRKFLCYRTVKIEKARGEKLLCLESLSKVCHVASRFLATLDLLSDHQLISLGKWNRVFTYGSLLSTIGYGSMAISLIWNAQKTKKDHHSVKEFPSRMAIQLSGALFEGIHYAATKSRVINQIGSVAGIIYAGAVINKLMPEQQKVGFTFKVPAQDQKEWTKL